MKIGLYADPHVSQNSSIIVGKQNEFSGRLDNLIQSFSWMEGVFKRNGCKKIICLGDMTDKPVLTAEEITAMSRFVGANYHLMIVGNHCRSSADGKVNSLKFFDNVFSEPTVLTLDNRRILLLPYSRKPIDLSQFKDIDVIFSHNDIKGFDFGGFVSSTGYNLSDIVDNCKLFINGHLHNGGWVVKDRVVNLGQLSGMNFSSCGGQWEPSIGILDLDTLDLEIIENPYAYRFKKESFKTLKELRDYVENLPEVGQYVLQVKVPESCSKSARKILDKSKKVVASRILVSKKSKSSSSKKKLNETTLENKSIYNKLRDFLSLQDSGKFDQAAVEEVISEIEKKEGSE